MMWAVGQEVGQTHGNIMRSIHKGRVTRVMPAGGCKVEFENQRGTRTFSKNGRQVPRSSVTSTLFPWSADHQKTLDAQQNKRAEQKARATAAADEERVKAEADRDALAYALERLQTCNDPRAERAITIITKMRGPDDNGEGQ